MSRLPRFAAGAALSLFVFGVAACRKSDGAGPRGAAAATPAKGGPPGGPPGGLPVEAAVARRDTVIDAIQATGQMQALQAIELRPDVEGRITAILVEEGREITKGAPLFRIDDAELRAEVAEAEADRDLANQSLERTKGLMTENASSQENLEKAEATARGNGARLAKLQVRLDRSTVRAPFTGVVGQRTVSLGDYVTTSTKLVTLQTVDPMRVSFEVPERYASLLKRGQEVTFRVAALPGKTFAGRVDFVDPVVRQPGRTITVKALTPNPSRALQSGMFIEAQLVTAIRPSATVIPEDAVLPLQGADYAWVVEGGKAARRQIELGVRTPGFVEVRSGVEPGEQVVVGGAERLQPGVPLSAKVVERNRPKAETHR